LNPPEQGDSVLPAFVIGIREGLEAALIVGIIAAFLVGAGARQALRPVWMGVAAAVAISLAGGVGLKLLDGTLPQRQQEAFETIIGVLAVGVVSWMIVWMRRNAATLRATIQAEARAALVTGSAAALVGMAFFAVLREGLETAVFLVAAFSSSSSPAATGTGAVLGILSAAALGYGIYRGGVRIDVQKFFRVTGVVLVVVAAGLLATAAHTAHEAGWLNALQGQALDMSWLVAPGTVRGALFTGLLGVQPQPVVAEVVVWALYVAVMLPVVLMPVRRMRRATATEGVAA
jgi:high-affinity iron transporter